MSNKQRVPFVVAIGVKEFRVVSTSRGAACREVFRQEIAAGNMKRQPAIDAETRFYAGVSVAAVNEHVGLLPKAPEPRQRKCVNCKGRNETRRSFCCRECCHEFKANGNVARVSV